MFKEDYKLKELLKVDWVNALTLIKTEKDADEIYCNHLKEFKENI